MHRTHRARSALALLAAGGALAAVFALAPSASSAAATSSTAITVRVEGATKTLVPTTAVTLGAGTVVKDGIPADSCSAASAAGALELATQGNWQGTWSASFSAYFLTGIGGLVFPSTGAEYWAFWVNNAPSSEGICGYDPKAGDHLLFFPDCFGKTCPKSAGILDASAPAVATVGKPFKVTVTAYDEAKGTPSSAAGATVKGGGALAKTGAGGTAKLSFAKPGHFTLRIGKRNAVRTELAVCVQSAAARTCG